MIEGQSKIHTKYYDKNQMPFDSKKKSMGKLTLNNYLNQFTISRNAQLSSM